MVGNEVNFPIQLLINYWEIRPALMGARLDELMRHGISHVTTFIPWQAVESDIAHSLTRFLQAAAERRIAVSLILSPEVGIHHPSSGLPKDVISRQDNMAKHIQGGGITVNLPPGSVSLPSFFASEFSKRYYSYLSRMDGFFADVAKQPGNLLENVTVVTTGSLWKYYRSPAVSAASTFGGTAGDYSGNAGLIYRQSVEQFYAQREFVDPTPVAANRWKTRQMDETNRRWFYQQSEDVFRNRTQQALRKKATAINFKEIELFTPEADPSFFYSNFLRTMSGGHSDFAKLSSFLDEAASRSSMGSSSPAAPFIHWSSMGGYRNLADSEKQFLILKTLLLMGGRGGGLLMDEQEWLSLSTSFRARTEALARSVSHGQLRVKSRALYLAPHLWSAAGTLWDELFKHLGPGARMVSSIDLVLRDHDSRLVVVDPTFILTRDVIQKLTGWARAGRVVVLPRSPLYTESARAELEKSVAQSKRIEIDLGIPYRLHALGEGKLIVYDLPERLSPDRPVMSGETLSSWQTFLVAMLSVAEVQAYCRLSDSRLSVIPMERRGRGLGLFVLNASRRAVAADIFFQADVSVSDLAASLAADAAGRAPGKQRPLPANRFSLDVPPCGVLPLAVDGFESAETESRDVKSSLLSEEARSEGLWN